MTGESKASIVGPSTSLQAWKLRPRCSSASGRCLPAAGSVLPWPAGLAAVALG